MKYNEDKLPKNKTCGDCISIDRCTRIYGHTEKDKYCDWIPIRFQLRGGQNE